MENVSWGNTISFHWVLKNAAGYHPGPVVPSAADPAPLTHPRLQALHNVARRWKILHAIRAWRLL